MKQQTEYIARQPDSAGNIDYSDAENAIWKTLITRQMACIQDAACDEFLSGLELLDLPDDRIPQLREVDRVLEPATGWKTAAVPALIGFDRFFELLSQRRFPVATFIRSRKDLDYIKEPDIFHEIFGHCAMLTNRHFADFTAHYGKLGVSATLRKGFIWPGCTGLPWSLVWCVTVTVSGSSVAVSFLLPVKPVMPSATKHRLALLSLYRF